MAPKGTDARVIDGTPGLTGWRLLTALLIGSAGLLFGSRALVVWADRLPDGFDAVRTVAREWDGGMQRAGLTLPYDTVHRWVGTVSAPRQS